VTTIARGCSTPAAFRVRLRVRARVRVRVRLEA